MLLRGSKSNSPRKSIKKYRVQGIEWDAMKGELRVVFIEFFYLFTARAVCFHRSSGEPTKPALSPCLLTARAVSVHRSSGEHPDWNSFLLLCAILLTSPSCSLFNPPMLQLLLTCCCSNMLSILPF